METNLSRINVTFSLTGGYRYDEETGMYLSYCPAFNVYAQGKTAHDAMGNLTSSVDLYLRTCVSKKLIDDVLDRAGFSIIDGNTMKPADAASEFVAFTTAKYEETFQVLVPIELIARQQTANQC